MTSKNCATACSKPGGSFDLDQKETELAELRDEASRPDLWDDPDEGRAVTEKLNRYERLFELVADLERGLSDAEVLLEFGDDDSRA
jgi:peptide chain release factor 2